MTIKKAIQMSGTSNPFSTESTNVAEETLLAEEILLYAVNANTLIVRVDKDIPRKINSVYFIQNCLNGVVAITDKRVFFCNSSKGNSSITEILINDIATVEDKYSILFATGTIRIVGPRDMIVLKLKRKAYKGFTKALSDIRKVN